MSLGTYPLGTTPLGSGFGTGATLVNADKIDDSSIAMRVSGLDSDNDWTFGRSKANYKTNSNCIAQNIQTRVKSFVNDYYLDITRGIDWDRLLGTPGTEDEIVRDVKKMVILTNGVISISNVSIVTNDDRHATMSITYRDFFSAQARLLEIEV